MSDTSKPKPPLPPPIRAGASRRPRRLRRATSPQLKKASRQPRLPIRKEISAGGVVVRAEGDTYLVALLKTEHKRGEVWVLPKGHVELGAGEKVSDAARREVQEEAGLADLSVKNQLGVTRFKFQVEDAVVYKTVHYFLMVTQQKTLQPQTDEGLLDARWFPIEEAVSLLAYDTDQEIVRRAAERIGAEPGPASPRRHRPTRPRRPLRIHT